MINATNAISTATVGRHSELLAITALLSNGYTVWEPAVPESADLAITRGKERKMIRAQVKTIAFRYKEGKPYYIVKAIRHNGQRYTKEDCDIFIGILGNRVFTFDNEELSEYWVKPSDITEKWTELSTGLTTSTTEFIKDEAEAV